MARGGRLATVAKRILKAAEFEAKRHEWLIRDGDLEYAASVMKQVIEPGKIANWIAPPKRGINGLPFDYEYVRFD